METKKKQPSNYESWARQRGQVEGIILQRLETMDKTVSEQMDRLHAAQDKMADEIHKIDKKVDSVQGKVNGYRMYVIGIAAGISILVTAAGFLLRFVNS